MKKRRIAPDHSGFHEQRRITICEEAARIMDQQGIRDYHMAKTKAVRRLGLGNRVPLPSNREIDSALHQRLRLFDGERWLDRCRLLWDLATTTMEMLASFEPRLVGGLLRGIVTEKTPVELHLFVDTPEDVANFCTWHSIPYESFDKRVRYRRARYALIPAFRFARDEAGIEMLVFSRKDIREAPLCPVAGEPMQRVALGRAREMQAQISPHGAAARP
jgi:hypothetical protein